MIAPFTYIAFKKASRSAFVCHCPTTLSQLWQNITCGRSSAFCLPGISLTGPEQTLHTKFLLPSFLTAEKAIFISTIAALFFRLAIFLSGT